MATVDVVVVSYNSADVLGACLDSIVAERGVASVTVVDNASADGTAALACARLGVAVIETGRNLGFAAAANRGAAAGNARFVLFLNPDATIVGGAVETMASAMNADPGLALVGPSVRNPDGSVYPSARQFPTMTQAGAHAFLGLMRPNNRFSRRYKFPEVPDCISGTALLVRRDLFDAIGGFDERYFMYVEDVDLSWRIRTAGGRIAVVPDAEVVHLIGGSSEGAPYRMIAAHSRSLFRFAVTTTTGVRRALLPVVALALAGRTLLAWVHRSLRGRPHAAP